MKAVDSVALEAVNKALGLAGPGAQVTELEDGLISQVLDISKLVGRGRAPISDGVKVAIFRTVHGVADDQVVAVDPYFTNSVPASSPNWPVPVVAGFDVWVLGASLQGIVSPTNINDAYLGLVGDISGDAAFTQDQAGGAVTSGTIRIPLAAWDRTLPFGGFDFGVFDSVANMPRIMTRVPRGMTIEYRCESGGATTSQCTILLGIYPVGLGQDALT